MLRSLLLSCCFLLPALSGLSLIRAAPTDPPLAFTGATIHTAAGPAIEKGVLVIDRGKIVAVGDADTPIPAGAKRIDATGKTIIPGLVDTHSHIGIFGRPGVTSNSDGNEGSGPVQPALRAIDAINPDDPSIRMAVAGGVTCANVMPGSGNVIGGQTLYIKLRGATTEEMRVVAQVLGGLKMANGENPKTFNFGKNKLPPATRMKLAALQRAEFVKAREYRRKWDEYRRAKKDGKDVPEPERNIDLEPLVEVLERRRTVHFHCHRADDLMTALRLAKEFDFEIVLQHATEGYRVAKELAESKVGVSLTLVDSPGGKLEVAGLLEENAALLAKAGVKVAINTDDPVTESRFYLRTGAIAVRGGMTEAQALQALTLNPATMLHLGHRLGSLEKGKDADFAVLSGPPFSVYSHVLETWIDGKQVFSRSRPVDWSYQAGGFALPGRDRLPTCFEPQATPLSASKAPALPKSSRKPMATSRTLAILAGRIHTVSGPSITNGVILVEDGRIAAVGPREKVAIPAGVPVLAAAVVTPGLIDANSSVGLSGGANVQADQDQDERSDPNQADLRVLDGFNPDEALLAFVRSQGVTVLHAVPGRVNVIAGQTGIFRTAGRTADRMTIRYPAGILVNLGEASKGVYPNKLPTTRMGTAALVRSALAKADAYRRKQSGKEKPPADAKLDALALALARKVPVLFAAHRADDLRTALRIAEEFSLSPRLHLATEGYLMADQLAAAKVPVVLHPPMQRIGGTLETLNVQLTSAAILAGKKVPLAIGTGFEGYVPKTRVLRHEAAIAMINGLGHDRALAAITLDAARILSLDGERGSIEKGKVADLVLYDGDCFEHSTHVTYTLIDGRTVYDREEELAVPFARRRCRWREVGWSAVWACGDEGLGMNRKKKIAAIVTEYRKWSHADVIVGKLLEGYNHDGKDGPNMEVVSLYADQFPPKEWSRDLAKKHGFTLYDTVAGAVTRGGKTLAVDGVLCIGEHGKYPANAKGQILYPRRKFFEEVRKVFAASKKSVPVFTDKHLAATWTDAKWMYDRARELFVPLMAGSSVPVTWRRPPLDLERDTPLTEAVQIGYGPFEGYGFHALEALQCIAERRKGGETGVKSVECLQGKAMWEAMDRGRWSKECLEAAMKLVPAHAKGDVRQLTAKTKDAGVFLIEYRDGFRGAVAVLNGWVYEGDGGAFTFAGKVKGRAAPVACQFYLQNLDPFAHFAYLVRAIDSMMQTGHAPYPVERTLLTTGILDAVMTSAAERNRKVDTPHLAIEYKPVDWPYAKGPVPREIKREK